MSVKYTFLSENENMQGTKLQICSDEKRSVSVLQYKAQGCLLYSHVDNDMRNVQMIVANWGCGTTIHMEEEDNKDKGYSDAVRYKERYVYNDNR